jgi:hypothetical protein
VQVPGDIDLGVAHINLLKVNWRLLIARRKSTTAVVTAARAEV